MNSVPSNLMLFVDSAVVVSVSVLRGDNGVGITFLGKSEVIIPLDNSQAYISKEIRVVSICFSGSLSYAQYN